MMMGNLYEIFLLLATIVGGSIGLLPVLNNYTVEERIRNAKSWEISSIMDPTADPCEDYYRFACGNWHTQFPASNVNSITGGFLNAIDEFMTAFSVVLNSVSRTDTASELKLKNLYKSCMSGQHRSTAEYRNIMKALIKEFGKMPALEGKKWQPQQFDWIQTVGNISHKYGINIIYDLNIEWIQDKMANELQLSPRNMQLLKDSNWATVKAYSSVVEKNLINFLGIKPAIAKRVALDIAKFEGQLLKAIDSVETDDKNTKLLPSAEGLKSYSKNLPIFLNISLGYVPGGPIAVTNYYAFEEIDNIVDKVPKATVANYIFYHLVSDFSNEFRWKRNYFNCTDLILKWFPVIVSKMTHRAYQLQDTVADFRKLYADIAKSMQGVLESDSLSWFDDENREFALEKLHAMKFFVDTFDNVDLDREYESLELNPTDYWANCKAIKSFKAQQLKSTLDKAPDLYSEAMNYNTPFYMDFLNAVFLTVSMFMSEYFTISNVPKALRFSRSGYLIGHEITHGFGLETRLFDRLGDFVGAVGDIDAEYARRVNCIYDQYDSYDNSKLKRPQDKTQDENIADIAGVALAYRAYARWLTSGDRTEEDLKMESLPNLNFTNKQLFFIHYSQTWCADYTASYVRLSMDDVHTIDNMRAYVPLVNFNEFAKAFNCPLGSQMNPKQKCSLT